MAELATAVSQLYTKVLIRNGHVAEPVSLYAETLHDFLERKASPVRPAFLLDAIRRFPELGWGLREALLDGCRVSKAARAFRQVQAFAMLQAMLQQQQREESRQAPLNKIFAFMSSVRRAVLETLEMAASDDSSASSLNAQRLKEVLRFALQAVRITARLAEGDSAQALACWPPSELEAISAQMQASERFRESTSLHGLLKEMLATLRKVENTTTEPTRTKRTADEVAKTSKKTAMPKTTKRAKRVAS